MIKDSFVFRVISFVVTGFLGFCWEKKRTHAPMIKGTKNDRLTWLATVASKCSCRQQAALRAQQLAHAEGENPANPQPDPHTPNLTGTGVSNKMGVLGHGRSGAGLDVDSGQWDHHPAVI